MFLYYNSFISYEYHVSLNFDISLCRFWCSCFDIRLMFLIIFLSDMHLSDFLCASLDQSNIPGLRERKKVLQLVNFICKIWQFLQQNEANFSNFCDKIWDFKWQFSVMPDRAVPFIQIFYMKFNEIQIT